MHLSKVISISAIGLIFGATALAAPPEGKGPKDKPDEPPSEAQPLAVAGISNGRRSDSLTLWPLDQSSSQNVSDSGGSSAFVLRDIAPRGVDKALLLDGANIRVVGWTLDGETVDTVETGNLNPGGPPNCMAIADSGNYFVYSVYQDNALRGASLNGASPTDSGVEFNTPFDSQVVSCEIGPNNEIYYVLVDASEIYSIFEEGNSAALYSSNNFLHHLDTSSDGNRLLFVEEAAESQIKYISLGTGSVTTTSRTGTSPHYACNSTSIIYSGRSRNKNVVLIDGNVFDDSGKVTHPHWYC